MSKEGVVFYGCCYECRFVLGTNADIQRDETARRGGTRLLAGCRTIGKLRRYPRRRIAMALNDEIT